MALRGVDRGRDVRHVLDAEVSTRTGERQAPEEATDNTERVIIDIPCDLHVDRTGFVSTFLGEARNPARIAAGAIVVTGDEVDPVLPRLVP